MESKDASSSLNDVLAWMCSRRASSMGYANFFGHLLNGCRKEREPGYGTVGVSLGKNGQHVLVYDPDFFEKLTRRVQCQVLIHEAAHIMLMHPLRMLKLIHQVSESVWLKLYPISCVAVDCAANDVAMRDAVKDDEKLFIFPEDKEMEPNLSYEEYFNALLKKAKISAPSALTKDSESDHYGYYAYKKKADKKRGGADKSPEEYAEGTNHHLWEEFLKDKTEEEILNDLAGAQKDWVILVEGAIEQTEKTRGTVPGHLDATVRKVKEKCKLSWAEILSSLIKSALSVRLQDSVLMPNPALLHLGMDGIEPYPGYERNSSIEVIVVIDTSGSIGADEYQLFLDQIRNICSQEEMVNARLIMVDAAIQYDEKFDPSSSYDIYSMGLNRYGCGGTDFRPAFRYLLGCDTDADWVTDAPRENDPPRTPDVVIYLTDGYAPVASPNGPVPDLLPTCPVIWAITPNGCVDAAMGDRIVHLK